MNTSFYTAIIIAGVVSAIIVVLCVIITSVILIISFINRKNIETNAEGSVNAERGITSSASRSASINKSQKFTEILKPVENSLSAIPERRLSKSPKKDSAGNSENDNLKTNSVKDIVDSVLSDIEEDEDPTRSLSFAVPSVSRSIPLSHGDSLPKVPSHLSSGTRMVNTFKITAEKLEELLDRFTSELKVLESEEKKVIAQQETCNSVQGSHDEKFATYCKDNYQGIRKFLKALYSIEGKEIKINEYKLKELPCKFNKKDIDTCRELALEISRRAQNILSSIDIGAEFVSIDDIKNNICINLSPQVIKNRFIDLCEIKDPNDWRPNRVSDLYKNFILFSYNDNKLCGISEYEDEYRVMQCVWNLYSVGQTQDKTDKELEDLLKSKEDIKKCIEKLNELKNSVCQEIDLEGNDVIYRLCTEKSLSISDALKSDLAI